VSLGANLKRERELRGISLEEISKATKISARLLAALEAERFEVLPGGIFRKSFLKSYAKYLGMNEEQVLHEYTLAFESVPLTPDEKQLPGKTSLEPKRYVAPVIAVILAVLIFIFGYFYLRRPKPPTNESVLPAVESSQPSKVDKNSSAPAEQQNTVPAPLGSPVSAPALVSTPANGLASPSSNAVNPAPPIANPQLRVLGELAKKPEPPPLPPGTFVEPVSSNSTELTIEATEQAWISVTSGENRLFSGILKPNESKKFSLRAPLKLILGNAGGVRAVVNGQLLAPLGKTGEKKGIEISAQNYKQFLPPGQ